MEEQKRLMIHNLQNLFSSAKKANAKYVGIKVLLPDSKEPEIIINPFNNFDSKLEYYEKTYTDDLRHKHDLQVEIIGFTYGNSFADIEKDLV